MIPTCTRFLHPLHLLASVPFLAPTISDFNMSDDEEYEYDYGSDGEYDYGSDGGEEGEKGEGDDTLIEIENSFYGTYCAYFRASSHHPYRNSLCDTGYLTEGDDLRTDNPTKAIEMFEKVVDLETKLGDQVKW